mmetsp:Transcript_11608/g.48300  ORF Transcript_11608/g.48300 Transcript_11608/m.48300 type:complete len:88 (+) Transcript_11608:942-1205(+)
MILTSGRLWTIELQARKAWKLSVEKPSQEWVDGRHVSDSSPNRVCRALTILGKTARPIEDDPEPRKKGGSSPFNRADAQNPIWDEAN